MGCRHTTAAVDREPFVLQLRVNEFGLRELENLTGPRSKQMHSCTPKVVRRASPNVVTFDEKRILFLLLSYISSSSCVCNCHIRVVLLSSLLLSIHSSPASTHAAETVR